MCRHWRMTVLEVLCVIRCRRVKCGDAGLVVLCEL